MSIVFFQKMINKNNKTFNKKIHTSNSENVVQKFVLLARHFLSTIFCYNKGEIFSTQSIESNGNFEW